MRKLLLSLAFILPALAFVSCSDDDDDNTEIVAALVGIWAEDTDYEYEVFHIQFFSNYTGDFWAEDLGEVDEQGKESFTWSISGNKMHLEYESGEYIDGNYSLSGNTLTLSYDGEQIVYKRES